MAENLKDDGDDDFLVDDEGSVGESFCSVFDGVDEEEVLGVRSPLQVRVGEALDTVDDVPDFWDIGD